jgi:polar amino acid transport system substrate-binding protein
MVIASCGLTLAGCDRLPRDPEHTLERAQDGVIRVGVAPNPPWTRAGSGSGQPSGVEANLVEDLARSLKARVEWVLGGESDLLRALESFQLDLVIGGLTEDTEWSKRVGFTRPYVRTTTLVGQAPGAPLVTDLTGKAVAVRGGNPAVRKLRKKGAVPIVSPDPWTGSSLVAGENWELLARGYTLTRFSLQEHRHVMAVAPGENAFLLRLERFLNGREGETEQALLAQGRP